MNSPWRVEHLDLDLGLLGALGVLGRDAVDAGVAASHVREDDDAADDGHALVTADLNFPPLLGLLRPRVLEHARVRAGGEVQRGRPALLQLVGEVTRVELRLV